LTNLARPAIIVNMTEQVVSTTKYQQIRQWILDNMEAGRFLPGDKLPSENEFCKQFGVSRNSVRQAINSLIGEGWLDSKKGIGTFCLLKTPQLTKDIGLICFFTGSYIFPRIARGCDQISHKNGFHLILNQSEFDYDKEREILIKLKKRGVDGVIIEPVFPGDGRSNLDLLVELEDSGTPVVLIDNYFPQRGFSRVALDDHAGGRLAAAHLWEKGHRRIGVISATTYQPKMDRKEGALSFLRQMGARIPEQWLLGYAGPAFSLRIDEIIDSFFTREKELPTALICTSDEESIELYKMIEKHGLKIPKDISVVSFDNSSLAVLPGISLTSIDHPGQYMGELATKILLEKIMNPKVSCHTTSLIEPRLVERDSVAQIQQSAE
jgi:GntR family transcriptional regulator of arabinose operon